MSDVFIQDSFIGYNYGSLLKTCVFALNPSYAEQSTALFDSNFQMVDHLLIKQAETPANLKKCGKNEKVIAYAQHP